MKQRLNNIFYSPVTNQVAPNVDVCPSLSLSTEWISSFSFSKYFLIEFLSLSAFCASGGVSSRTNRDLKIQDENIGASYLPIVQTQNGQVRGFTETSIVTQTDVDIFLGVNNPLL